MKDTMTLMVLVTLWVTSWRKTKSRYRMSHSFTTSPIILIIIILILISKYWYFQYFSVCVFLQDSCEQLENLITNSTFSIWKSYRILNSSTLILYKSRFAVRKSQPRNWVGECTELNWPITFGNAKMVKMHIFENLT